MIYPKFLKDGDTIGICAPSAGVGHKLDKYNKAIEVLENNGFNIVETKNVRKNNPRSTTAKNRAKELDELMTNKKIDAIMCAAGGDYMLEIMPYINLEHIKENPKWICGMSDPTNLLYLVTTNLDIATMYGNNAGSFYNTTNSAKRVAIDYLKGKIVCQHSYKKYYDFFDEAKESKVKWITKEDIEFEGRLIGGCLDVIEKLIGTKYDSTSKFIDKYKDDGIIWYFDIFNMSALSFYLTLLQFKNADYFKYCKGVIVGRVAIPTTDDPKFTYQKAADLALKDIPHILEVDIGHVDPSMTFINGALTKVSYKDGKGKIRFTLK